MRLSDFLDQAEMTDAEFARRIGVSRQAVLRYRAGRLPRQKIIEKIQQETEGKVCANDLMQAGAAE